MNMPLQPFEFVARYVLFSRWVRNEGTIRPDAFMPADDGDTSVQRHINQTEDQIWARGAAVATQRALTLHGRADVQVAAIIAQELYVDPNEPPENHANIRGWPAQVEKSLKKAKAQQIADASTWRAR